MCARPTRKAPIAKTLTLVVRSYHKSERFWAGGQRGAFARAAGGSAVRQRAPCVCAAGPVLGGPKGAEFASGDMSARARGQQHVLVLRSYHQNVLFGDDGMGGREDVAVRWAEDADGGEAMGLAPAAVPAILSSVRNFAHFSGTTVSLK